MKSIFQIAATRWLGRRGAGALAALALLGALPALAQQLPTIPAPTRPGAAATGINDLDTTITLALNNVNLDQIVKFVSDTTGKYVLKQRNIQTQVTVNSPVPLSKRRALGLIYETLKMDNIYVIELEDMIQIVGQDAIKSMPVQEITDVEDMQAMPDSMVIARRIYHLKNIRVDNIKPHLEKFVPDSAMTLDAKTNTLILTDQITRLKRYDRIVRSLDTMDSTERIIEIFKLKHADSLELATLLGNILMESATPGAGQPGGVDPRTLAAMRPGDNFSLASRSRSYTSRDRGTSTPIVSGAVTIVPDPRMNWLVVSCPKSQLAEITRLIGEFDQEELLDVRARLVPILHTEASAVASVVRELFREATGGAAKDVIRAVPSDEGNNLVVMSSAANYAVIQELIKKLDTEESEKRETRTFPIKHVEVNDLSKQLQDLFDQRSGSTSRYSTTYYFGDYNSGPSATKPTFVPSPRTSSIMVLARPRDFPFIEAMMKELDVPMDPSMFEPHVYRIRHTDANELVKVLETLFEGKTTTGTSRAQDEFFWRPTSSNENTDTLRALFGQTRFVVDNVTNTIVALAANRKNYEILDAVVKKLDQVDPESTEVLVYDLKYADALEVADHINNLFSEGAVQRAGQGQSNQQNNQQNTTGATSTTTNTNNQTAAAIREVVYPWQSTSQQRTGTGTGAQQERPINTMIGNVRVVPDTRSNKILVAAPSIYFTALKSLVENLDKQEPQVYIATKIIEVTRGQDRRVGVRWTPDPNTIDPAELDNAFLGLGQLGFINPFGKDRGTPVKVNQTSNLGGVLQQTETTTQPGNAILGANVNIALLVQLLVKNNLAEVISEPKLTVNNNEQGNIFVGSEFPFRVDSQVSTQGTLSFGTEYREVGIKLDVTPHINHQGEVVLSATLENSKVRPGELVDDQVITDKTTFHTELAVESKQTMVIGGIVVEDSLSIRRAVPILGRIPIVGLLFKKTDRSESTRELVVFITPEVLNSREEDDSLLERARKELQEIREAGEGRTSKDF